MKLALIFVLTGSISANIALAQTVKTSDLGQLELRYTTASVIDSYPGSPIAAQAGFRPGEAISLVTPHRVQQIAYLTEPGSYVARGQIVARLSGPEIHHFLTEFEVLVERLAVAEKRFESNRKLYERKAIDEGRWIEISESYYALQLDYEHMRHFRELLEPDGDNPDSLMLRAPADGLLHYRQQSPGVEAGEELALIIPGDSLRLRLSVPLARRRTLESLSFNDCSVAVDSISSIADDYFVTAWSEALVGNCRRLPGERLMVTPHYAESGFLVPQAAVMQWRGGPTVLVKNKESLEIAAVELLASTGSNYFGRCSADLSGRSILSSSVSAVQGVLMGLGGE